MADKEPPRPPRLTGTNAPPPVKTKLCRNTLRMQEAMRDPAFVEEVRKNAEEFQREYNEEQKRVETANQKKTGGSARAGARGDEAVSEDREKDNDHGRNEPTEAQGSGLEAGTAAVNTATASDEDVVILQCMDCRFDRTVPSDQKRQNYSSIEEYREHHKAGYHSRKAGLVRAFHLVRVRSTQTRQGLSALFVESRALQKASSTISLSIQTCSNLLE
jgi:hypothetical protein